MAMGTVLLLGGSGVLGRAWRQLLDGRGIEYAAPQRHEFDLTNPRSMDQIFDRQVRVVINCAAWTNVDAAQKYREAADQLNAHAPGELAQRCAGTDALLVHYSTDYVFNGRAAIPYPVDTPVDPINFYGQTKADGEQRIVNTGCRHMIIRTSGLYAAWGHNFVRTMVRLIHERSQVKVVDDQRCRLTSARQLASASLELIERKANDTSIIWHVCGGGHCSWYEVACFIAGHLNVDCQVASCRTEEYPTSAERPRYSVLDLRATEQVIGPMAPWERELATVMKAIGRDTE